MEFFLTMDDRTHYHDYYAATFNNTKFAKADSSKGIDNEFDILLQFEHKEFTIKSEERTGFAKLAPNTYKCIINNPDAIGFIQQVNACQTMFGKKLYTHMSFGDFFFDMYHVPVVGDDYSMLCVYRNTELVGVAYLNTVRDKGRSFYRVVCNSLYHRYILLLLLYYDRYLTMFTSKNIYYAATTINPVTNTDFLDKMPDQLSINKLYFS